MAKLRLQNFPITADAKKNDFSSSLKKDKFKFENIFASILTFDSQWYPTPKVSEIEATVLYFIWEVKSLPTHEDNFSHEGKKEGKVGLPM